MLGGISGASDRNGLNPRSHKNYVVYIVDHRSEFKLSFIVEDFTVDNPHNNEFVVSFSEAFNYQCFPTNLSEGQLGIIGLHLDWYNRSYLLALEITPLVLFPRGIDSDLLNVSPEPIE
jgi:hypothetical protein